jgi:phage terminase small subunit
MHNLTYRQRRFVQAVDRGATYAQAARLAGYSESMANVAAQKLARHPGIAAALAASRERQEARRRLKPYQEIALELERIDPDIRGLVEALIQSLAEGKLIQAKMTASGLIDALKARKK